MPDKKISTPQLSLPKGGGAIKGIGETFQSHPFSGTGSFSIPIYTTPARGFEPQLSLDYGSGSGNGPFGAGFSLSIPNVARRTRLGMPKYDDSDLFVLSGADDLVKKFDNQGDSWKLDTYPDPSGKYAITRYRPRTEGLFAKIEQWVKDDDGDIHWQITTKDNIRNIYGKSTAARIADPEDARRVFQWLLEESFDAKGNRILYEYKQEDGANIANAIQEAGRAATAQVYPHKIKYGNFSPDSQGENDWHFEVVFDYGERKNWDDPIYDPTDNWTVRQDPFSSYKSGFEIRTYRLCRGIFLFHRFEEINEGNPFLVRAMKFSYDEGPVMSFLSKVQEIGYRKYEHAQKPTNKALPPLELTYNRPDPTFLTRFDALFFKDKITEGPLSPQLWRELSFKGIEIAKEAELRDTSQVGSKSWRLSDGKNTYQLIFREERIEVFDPSLKPQFLVLDLKNQHGFPGQLNRSDYQLVDFYGEGLPGVLYSDEDSLLYWRPNGGGQFSAPQKVPLFPLGSNLKNKTMSLMDLGGDGQLDLVVHDPQHHGYFSFEADGSWENFRSFPAYPNDYSDGEKEIVDITGDGFADLVTFETDAVKYNESKGKDGFDTAVRRLDANQIGYTTHRSQEEVYRLTDVFGDGSAHLLRIREGEVACWPNLGYGRFGKKILLANAPSFEGRLDASRLFLADIDGSGTTDVIYAYQDRLAIYYNQSGNRFSDPVLMKLPRPFTDIDQIQFADILGTGTACLIMTTLDHDLSIRHEYYSFTGGRKPHLLTEVNNNLGGLSRIHYASSTKFYLEDLHAGQPWITRLSFPVQIVERTETIDYFSETKLVSRFKYHDGYFDPVDRQFRGFGFVERWDTEDFELFSQKKSSTEDAHYVAPVYTKSWYHTGAYFEKEGISNYYQKKYFQGDDAAYNMPDSAFENTIPQSDGSTIQQAHWALHGTLLRQEVYGMDEGGTNDLTGNPYVVSASNVFIRMVQPKVHNPYAVFLVNHRESINYHYERDPADPRIEHDFTLEVDDYGHTTQSCKVFYPRRSNTATDPAEKVYDQQQALKVVLAKDRFTNIDGEFYLLGVPVEEQSFEIGGLSLNGAAYFGFDQIAPQIREALQQNNMLPYENPLSGNTKQARLLSWHRHFYWDKNGIEALPLGEVSPLELPHHSASAVFSNGLLTAVFGDKLPSNWVKAGAELETKAGYQYEEDTQLWWNPGIQAHYLGAAAFFFPNKTIDQFKNKTEVFYDSHYLMPTKTVDALENTINSIPDYYLLRPSQVTDINDNISQALFDPLGQVIATSIRGIQEGNQLKGDSDINEYRVQQDSQLTDMFAQPHQYLQSATSFLYYDLDAWQLHRQPVNTLSLLREIHVSDLKNGENTPIQYHLSYSDGFGRTLENKIKAEPGPAKILDTDNIIQEIVSPDRWLTSGRTIYNNKGKPVKQYEPFYSDGPDYKGETILSQTGVTPILHYDPLLRVIRVDTPKGFFSKSEFTPWYQKHYDENDTVTDSKYYHDHYASVSTEDQTALDQAVDHYDTPDIHLFDNMGRTFSSIQLLKENGGEIQYLRTLSSLDIQGRVLSSIDPRLLAAEKAPNFEYAYAMDGEILREKSVDAGINFHLHNAVGNQYWTCTARDYNQLIQYDELHRRKQVFIFKNKAGGAVPSLDIFNLVEEFTYGEGQASAKDNNLLGKIYRIKDLSGILTYESYHFQGQALSESRQMSIDYDQPNNWQAATGVNMESEIYETVFTYDALGRRISQKAPDGSITFHQYDQQGLLKKIDVNFANGMTQEVVTRIQYNAKGQRETISYGNGVRTRYQYEETTFRMLNCKSTRPSQDRNGNRREPILQDIEYRYDPVGSITQIIDSSFKTVYNNNKKVNPIATFTYDSLYRLTQATGRQHEGINANTFKNNQKDDFYLIEQLVANPTNAKKLENYSEKYTYDWAGNLIEKKHTAKSSWTRKLPVAEDSNRLKGLEYDASGNLRKLHLNSAVDLSFNCCENLVKAGIIHRPNELDDSDYYTYDFNEMRTRKVSERFAHGETVSLIEEKIYLGNYEVKRLKSKNTHNDTFTPTLERQTLRVMDGQSCVLTVHYWKQDDGQTEVDTPGTRKFRWQLDNHLGSVSMEVDTDAQLISYEEYFPYGGTALLAGRSQKEVKLKEYRYSGKERDDSTGLYYYGARYYAPWLGRWLKPDPAGTVDGLNLYAFVRGNPINYMDNTGKMLSRVLKGRRVIINRQPKRSVTVVRFPKSVEHIALRLSESETKGLEKPLREGGHIEKADTIKDAGHLGLRPGDKSIAEVSTTVGNTSTGIRFEVKGVYKEAKLDDKKTIEKRGKPIEEIDMGELTKEQLKLLADKVAKPLGNFETTGIITDASNCVHFAWAALEAVGMLRPADRKGNDKHTTPKEFMDVVKEEVKKRQNKEAKVSQNTKD